MSGDRKRPLRVRPGPGRTFRRRPAPRSAWKGVDARLLSASEQDTVMTLVTAGVRHCRAPSGRPGQHEPSERPSSSPTCVGTGSRACARRRRPRPCTPPSCRSLAAGHGEQQQHSSARTANSAGTTGVRVCPRTAPWTARSGGADASAPITSVSGGTPLCLPCHRGVVSVRRGRGRPGPPDPEGRARPRGGHLAVAMDERSTRPMALRQKSVCQAEPPLSRARL